MTDTIQISAKNLGAIALPYFCPRCFWLKQKLRNKLPYQIFPGIFSSIDSYNKKIVDAHFEVDGTVPSWLKPLGDIVENLHPPHHSKFRVLIDEFNILLTGSPDAIFKLSDGNHVIVDYKTAKFTEAQDALLPMYDVQLNSYARIAEECGPTPVSRLVLMYAEPETSEENARRDWVHAEHSFRMGFSTYFLEIDLSADKLLPLLKTVRTISELDSAPESKVGCKDCVSLDELLNWVQV